VYVQVCKGCAHCHLRIPCAQSALRTLYVEPGVSTPGVSFVAPPTFARRQPT
jgi:hypothetical protein